MLTRSRDVVEGKGDLPVADIHVDVLQIEGVRQPQLGKQRDFRVERIIKHTGKSAPHLQKLSAKVVAVVHPHQVVNKLLEGHASFRVLGNVGRCRA